MKHMVLLPMVLMATISAGCRDNARNASTNGSTAGTTGRNDVPGRDADFVRDMGVMNLAEVGMGRLATAHGSTDAMKKFGQLMIDDHTKALDALRTVASQHSIEVPAQVDDKHRDHEDKVAKKQGLDFDKAYSDEMVEAHEDLVDKLESRIDKANLAEYKAQMKDRVSGTTVEERGQAIAIIPEKSDNPVTMSINKWAADTYPIAAAHLDAARILRDGVKKRTTH
jgi:predicted outer membrane protein